MEVENDKEEGDSYKEKLLVAKGVVPFSAFDGRCYDNPDKEVPPAPIMKEDVEHFKELPIFVCKVRIFSIGKCFKSLQLDRAG